MNSACNKVTEDCRVDHVYNLKNVRSVAVLPVVNEQCEQSSLNLESAVKWYHRVSNGHLSLNFELLPHVQAGRNLGYYSPLGGMGSAPTNSQTLVCDTLELLDSSGRELLVSTNGILILTVHGRFKAHTWQLPNGGKFLGKDVWCRRYAIVPHNASLGAIAHELGHLLFEWPDLAWEKSLGEECLMAQGAWRDNGHNPAPPCGPLLWQAGWRDALTVDGETRAGQLSAQHLGRLSWNGQQVLVERRDDHHSPRLLVYSYQGTGRMLHPKLHGHVPVRCEDNDQLLLGLIAPLLRIIWGSSGLSVKHTSTLRRK